MITSSNPKVRKGMDLVDEMDKEELDALVDYIRVVYKSKRAQDSARMFAELKVGDRVKFTRNTRPKYLAGLTGVIEEKRDTRVLMKFDNGPVGKFRSGRILAHPSSLEVVSR